MKNWLGKTAAETFPAKKARVPKKKRKPKYVSLIINDESTEGTISLEEPKRLDRRFRDAEEGETVTICNSH